jgi:hypothetical protein
VAGLTLDRSSESLSKEPELEDVLLNSELHSDDLGELFEPSSSSIQGKEFRRNTRRALYWDITCSAVCKSSSTGQARQVTTRAQANVDGGFTGMLFETVSLDIYGLTH